MNYLAHLYLAGPDDDHRIGALLGDFMRGQELSSFAGSVQVGVLHHRAVDRFTDSHPVFRQSRDRLAPRFRRFSGVIIDVFYDHFLARGWQRWCRQSLAEFATDVYTVLETRLADLPPRMQRAVRAMIADDWLSSYAEPKNVARALSGLARRVKRENPLGEAIAELARHEAGLSEDFEAFFPALIEHCGT